jgi:hypothetical protein
MSIRVICSTYLVSLFFILALARAGDDKSKASDTNFWLKFIEAAKKADPEEAEKHILALKEAACFMNELAAEHKFPAIPADAHGEFEITAWDMLSGNLSYKSFSFQYPFNVRADFAITNGAIGVQVYKLSKPSDTGLWTIVTGWLYDRTGTNVIGWARLPDASSQQDANKTAHQHKK